MRNTEFDRWLKLVSQPARLLLVEDDYAFVSLLEKVGETYNCVIEIADSVEGAIDKLKREKIDLVILDCKLNGPGGVEVIHHMFSLSIKVPIVILSGYITTELVDEARQLGLVAFVAKPTNNVIDQLHGLFRILGIKERFPRD